MGNQWKLLIQMHLSIEHMRKRKEEKMQLNKLLATERSDAHLLARLYNALVKGLKASFVFNNDSAVTAKQARENFLSVASATLSKFLPKKFDFNNDLQIS